MAYGRIDFTHEELDMVGTRIADSETFVSVAVANAGSVQEKAFYEAAAIALANRAEDFGARRAGVYEFTEEELCELRGTVSGHNPTEMARRCVDAKRAADPMLPRYERDYEVWTALREKLERPFVEDRSQDCDKETD